MKRQEAQSTRKTSLGSLDPIEKAVVAKFTKQIGNIEEVLSMHDAPDAPVWAANCSYGTEIILAWNRAKRAVMYEIRSEDADWGEEGYVWQGTSTMITLPARTRSETFYIKSINAAGMYSEQASSITLENEAPSAPVFTLVSSPSGFTVLLSDTESDVVKVVLSITEVDEQQKPLGETVQRVCEEKTYFFAAEPRTNWKVSAVAYDIIGAGEESAAKYVTVSGIDAWHIIDIPEHIVSPSHLTESLMEEIESAVDGVDYLNEQMSEAQQRLSQAESELGSIDGRVTDTETKITELEGEIATKVSQTDYDTLVGRVETAETNITQNAQAIATKASQSSVDTLEGRVSAAETTITQQAQEIASKASQSSVDVLEGRVSAAESTITQHGNAISSVVAEVESIDGRVKTAESAITQLGSEITLKVQVRQDGKLVIAGIGMAVDEDGQSEVAVLADRFRVLTSVDGEMKSVFAVDTETGKVYVLGDLIATGLIRATEVQAEVAKHLLLAAQVATVDHLGALKIEAGAITVGGEAPGISLTKPEGAKLWHFDGSLVSTDGIAPESGAVATLRPGEGRFGGAVAVEEGTTNLVNNPFFEKDWTRWGVQNATNGSTRTIKEVEGAYGGKVAVLDRPAGGGPIGIYNECGGGLAEGDIVTVSFRARRTKGTSNVAIRWGGGATHIVPISEEWGRYEITIPKDGNQNIIFIVLSDDSTIELDATQVEVKPFATSFVDGTRAEGRLEYPGVFQQGTISAWVYLDKEFLQSLPTTDSRCLLWGNATSGNTEGTAFLYYWRSGQNLRYRVVQADGTRSDIDAPVPETGWHHFVTVMHGDKMALYIDGEKVNERKINVPMPSNNTLQVGSASTGGHGNFLFDELLILPYAATPEQIQAWYAMGAPFVDPNSAINADASPISAARGQVYIGEPGIAVANGAMIFVSGTFSHDQLGRLITAAVDRPLTTDPGGQKSVSAPVEISAARGVEIYKGKLNVWAGTGGAGDKRYIHDGRVTDDGIVGMDAQKLTGTVAMENLPEHLIRTAPGVSGAVMSWGSVRVAESATVNITYTTAMPYTPLVYAWERHGQFLSSAWVGLNLENISTTGFRLRNSSSTDSGTIYWMSVCASHDPSTSTCNQCQETCQKNCQNYCQDSCETGVCQLTCQSDCKTTCESACQDACMFSCQLPPPLTLWE